MTRADQECSLQQQVWMSSRSSFHQYLFIICKYKIMFPLYAFNFWNSTIFSQFDCKWQIVSFLICGRHNMWIVDIFMHVQHKENVRNYTRLLHIFLQPYIKLRCCCCCRYQSLSVFHSSSLCTLYEYASFVMKIICVPLFILLVLCCSCCCYRKSICLT